MRGNEELRERDNYGGAAVEGTSVNSVILNYLSTLSSMSQYG